MPRTSAARLAVLWTPPRARHPAVEWSSRRRALGEGSVGLNRAELAEETELVELGPAVDSNPFPEEIDRDSIERDGVACRGDAEEWALMCAGNRPSADDLLVGPEDVVHFELEIRKGPPETEDHALEAISAADEVRRNELLERRLIALVPCPFDEGAHVRNVPVGRHAATLDEWHQGGIENEVASPLRQEGKYGSRQGTLLLLDEAGARRWLYREERCLLVVFSVEGLAPWARLPVKRHGVIAGLTVYESSFVPAVGADDVDVVVAQEGDLLAVGRPHRGVSAAASQAP